MESMPRLTPADKGRANARLHLGDTEKVHRVLQPVSSSTCFGFSLSGQMYTGSGTVGGVNAISNNGPY